MKVGDLVELSNYGVKLKMLHHARDKVGVVVYVIMNDTILVDWCGSALKNDRLTRKDLRHAK